MNKLNPISEIYSPFFSDTSCHVSDQPKTCSLRFRDRQYSGFCELKGTNDRYPRIWVSAHGQVSENLDEFTSSSFQSDIPQLAIGDGLYPVFGVFKSEICDSIEWSYIGYLGYGQFDSTASIGHVVGQLYNFTIGLSGGSNVWYPQHRVMASRRELEFHGWLLTIDSLCSSSDITSELRRGDFVPTHVLRIEKANGRLFSLKTSDSTVEFLEYFFAFVQGNFVGPSKCCGRRAEDPFISLWPGRKLSPHSSIAIPWSFSEDKTGWLSLLPLMYSRWNDKSAKAVLTRVITIYAECNNIEVSVESRIPQAQAALETLAEFVIVDMENIFQRSVFRRFRCERQLFELIHILLRGQSEVSSQTYNVSGFKSRLHIAVQVRNQIVHPDRSNVGKLAAKSPLELLDVLDTFLNLIELSTLYICQYPGKVRDKRNRGSFITVPWHATS